MTLREILNLMLYFWIASAISIVGKIFFAVTNLRMDTIENEFQALLLPTIILPFILLVTAHWRKVPRRSAAGIVILAGVICWFLAGSISAFAHRDVEYATLTYIVEILSGTLVYFASRTMELDEKSAERLIACIMGGALIPGISGLIIFYQVWGIPSLKTLLNARYDLVRIQPYVNWVEQTGAASCFFSFLAAPCIFVLLAKLFSRRVRILVAIALTICMGNLLIDESRTAFITLALTWMMSLIYLRSAWRGILLPAVMLCGFVLMPAEIVDEFSKRLSEAVTYDRTDRSASDRLDSISFGWGLFMQYPLYGVGPGQSMLYNPFYTAHELPIAQAEDTGALALVGILLLSVAVPLRAFAMLRRGRADTISALRFMFIVGPAAYFLIGLFGAVWVYNTVQNSWICFALGFTAFAEARFRPLPRRAREVRLPLHSCEPAHV